MFYKSTNELIIQQNYWQIKENEPQFYLKLQPKKKENEEIMRE